MTSVTQPRLGYQTNTESGALEFSSLLVSGDEIAHGEQAIGMIVMPAARSSQHLAHGIRLAKESGAQLVVLASHSCSADAAAASLAQADVHGFVVELPRDYVLPMSADFVTGRHEFADHTSNLSDKRNLGLLLSRLTATNVFFLDDDIRGLSAKQLRQSGGVLRSGCSVAGKLAETAFFPKIYNEDWLFMHDAVESREAAVLDAVRQLPYESFRDPARAVSEEFGDVLAEGVYYLLAMGTSFREIGEDYWLFAVQRRKRFINNITEHLTAKSGYDKRVPLALASLKAAKSRLDTFTPRDLTTYIKVWRDDIGRWQERVGKLPKDLSLSEAAAFLDLPTVAAKRLDKKRRSLVQ